MLSASHKRAVTINDRSSRCTPVAQASHQSDAADFAGHSIEYGRIRAFEIGRKVIVRYLASFARVYRAFGPTRVKDGCPTMSASGPLTQSNRTLPLRSGLIFRANLGNWKYAFVAGNCSDARRIKGVAHPVSALRSMCFGARRAIIGIGSRPRGSPICLALQPRHDLGKLIQGLAPAITAQPVEIDPDREAIAVATDESLLPGRDQEIP